MRGYEKFEKIKKDYFSFDIYIYTYIHTYME